MIRFRILSGAVAPVLEADNGEITIWTGNLTGGTRAQQARALVDAAAALLDDGTDQYAAAFERLHDVLDALDELADEAGS